MILSDAVTKLRKSTCAVAHLAEAEFEALRALEVGAKVNRLPSTTIATGFLIRHDLVLTNRHVAEEIAKDHAQVGHLRNWYAEFNYPGAGGGWSQTYRRVGQVFALIDTNGHSHDVAILRVNQATAPEFTEHCGPVQFGELSQIVVGADVAICGFPLGDTLLNKDALFRFGPVVHRGIVSAVAPYDAVNVREITTFLTDMNTAGGMSGSPVFLPDTASVVGLHFAGVTGTVGCALPVDTDRVAGWMKAADAVFARRPPSSLRISAGGDIIG